MLLPQPLIRRPLHPHRQMLPQLPRQTRHPMRRRPTRRRAPRTASLPWKRWSSRRCCRVSLRSSAKSRHERLAPLSNAFGGEELRYEPSFFRPTEPDAGMNYAIRDPASFRCFCQRHAGTLIRDKPTIALVSRLLGHGCPSAILRAVALVVINALKCRAWRPLAHMRKEVFKREPTLTDLDAAATVARKAIVIWVAAACQHCAPHIVFDHVLAAARRAVRRFDFGRNLSSPA